MSIKITANMDFAQSFAENFRIEVGANTPASNSGAEGQLFFNTTESKLYVKRSGDWFTASDAGLPFRNNTGTEAGQGVYILDNNSGFTLPAATGSGNRYIISAINVPATHTTISVTSGDHFRNGFNSTDTTFVIYEDLDRTVEFIDSASGVWHVIDADAYRLENMSDSITENEDSIDTVSADLDTLTTGTVATNTSNIQNNTDAINALVFNEFVRKYADFATFPSTPVDISGAGDRIYIAADTGKIYRYDSTGSAYVEIGNDNYVQWSASVSRPATGSAKYLYVNTDNGDLSRWDGSAYVDVSVTTAEMALKADLVGGTVPSSQLPGYVDDVIEVADATALAAEAGVSGKVYVQLDTNEIYRWGGSSMINISAASVDVVEYADLAAITAATGKTSNVIYIDQATNSLYRYDGTNLLVLTYAPPSQTVVTFTAANPWVVNHNLGKFVDAIVMDSTGREIYADVVQTDINTLTINHSSNQTGKVAYN